MMGFAMADLDVPVQKSNNAITLLGVDEVEDALAKSTNCIRCGRCVKNCPMHLMPNYLAVYSKALNFGEAEKNGAMSCVECGTCSYNCPAQIPIVQYIRNAKVDIRQRAAKKRADEAAKAK